MIQKLDKTGKSSIDNANIVILDKNGNVKKIGNETIPTLTHDVLIDCGTFIAPSENILIDCGLFI